MKYIIPILLLAFLSVIAYSAEKAEPQISFAQESKPHSYYVQQAELWAKELSKDSLSENSWYNYFRACRNAHGTADWKSDFVNESPYLMEGGDIVKLIHKYIPDTFMDYYLSYMTNGIGTGNYENLLKAYEMNPDFPGIHSSLISYAESSRNYEFRKEINKEWYKKNFLSAQLLNYCHNLLMSLDPNAILFVQHDNDTYPVWMLQDALNFRTDVKVISIDFLLLDEYRDSVYKELNIPALDLGEVDIDEYRQNWQKVVGHIIKNYSGSRPIYCSMTLFNSLYQEFDGQLFVSGLALRYSKEKLALAQKNRNLVENTFLLDYLSKHFYYDRNQANVDIQNTNYISCFKDTYDLYIAENKEVEALKIKDLAIKIAERINNPDYLARVASIFQ